MKRMQFAAIFLALLAIRIGMQQYDYAQAASAIVGIIASGLFLVSVSSEGA